MGYIEKNLQKDEEIIMNIKLSSLVWLEIIFLFIIVIGIPAAIKRIIMVFTLDQSITTKRVIQKSGWISRNIEEMRISKIETVEFTQSIFGRIFGYGDVRISGVQTKLNLRFVEKPKAIKNKIDGLLE
tara:strand:- start:1304 stop:1687 length:384 start_codon:yes stop_codon:yes gene_type:complete